MESRKVLIIEDNEMLRTMLTDFLTGEKFEVTAFSDPSKFIAQQEKNCCHREGEPCFDVIMTDNQMPVMTGVTFLEKLKGVGCKLADSRKAVISGNWSEEDLRRTRKLGSKVFYKPVSFPEMIQWLSDID